MIPNSDKEAKTSVVKPKRKDNRKRMRADNRERKRLRVDNRKRLREDNRARVREDRVRLDFDLNKLQDNYENMIRIELFKCCSCDGLWFRNSLRVTDDLAMCCMTCYRDIKNNRVPRLSVLNGFSFPVIPEALRYLTELEERLVSPRIPFMRICSLGVDGQFGLKGNVVNVPIDVETNVKILPRKYDETFTVQLRLKRMLEHKSSEFY